MNVIEYIFSIIEDFIPIILLLILLYKPTDFVLASESILGKLCAVLLIIFYTSLDPINGLLICTIVILYYQSDFVEMVLNKHEFFEDDGDVDFGHPDDMIDDGIYITLTYDEKPKTNSKTKMRATSSVKESTTYLLQ
jgi:hypothetical protein